METSIEELKAEIERLRQEKTTLVDALKANMDVEPGAWLKGRDALAKVKERK